MKISELDSFKAYEVKNMIVIKGGEDQDSFPITPPLPEEDKPWWHFW